MPGKESSQKTLDEATREEIREEIEDIGIREDVTHLRAVITCAYCGLVMKYNGPKTGSGVEGQYSYKCIGECNGHCTLKVEDGGNDYNILEDGDYQLRGINEVVRSQIDRHREGKGPSLFEYVEVNLGEGDNKEDS